MALVTGGSSGIGLEITRQLGASSYGALNDTAPHSYASLTFCAAVAHGASAVICGRRAAVVDDAVSLLRNEGHRGKIAGTTADVRSPEDAARLMTFVGDTFGKQLHILVNCAAGNFLALPEGA